MSDETRQLIPDTEGRWYFLPPALVPSFEEADKGNGTALDKFHTYRINKKFTLTLSTGESITYDPRSLSKAETV